MYRLKAIIGKTQTTKGAEVWALCFNAVDDLGNGKGKRVSGLLPYLHAFKSKAEAFENLRVILRGDCPCLLNTVNRQFKRVGEVKSENEYSFEWVEILKERS